MTGCEPVIFYGAGYGNRTRYKIGIKPCSISTFLNLVCNPCAIVYLGTGLHHGVLIDGFEHIVRGVAHAVLGVPIGHTGGQHNRGIKVSKIMEAVMRQAQLPTNCGKPFVHSLAGQLHQVVIGALCTANDLQDIGRQAQLSVAAVRLCSFDHRAIGTVHLGLADVQDIAADAIPGDAPDFRLPQAHPDGQQQRQLHFCPGGCGQDRRHLCVGGNSDFMTDFLWQGGAQRHVRIILPQGCAEQAVGIADALRR